MRVPANFKQIRDTVVTTMFVGRRESPTGIRFFGENIQQENVAVDLDPQGSPDPIRQSMYAGEGRPPNMRRAGENVALHMNIAGINSVMEDTFLSGKVNPAPQWTRVRQGRADGGQLPFQTREIIAPGYSAPYGNRVAVQSTHRPRSIVDVDFGGLTYNGLRRRI